MQRFIPGSIFFTNGVGYHQQKLQSYELALRSAGIEKCNIVSVSSIFPPECSLISREQGTALIQPGQIAFVVQACERTNEPNRLIFAAVGLAKPLLRHHYGYISEHHGFGETKKKAADTAEDLAVSMLASALGIEIDPNTAWNEQKKLYVAGKNRQFESHSAVQTAEGNKDGLWTTAIACAVMLLVE